MSAICIYIYVQYYESALTEHETHALTEVLATASLAYHVECWHHRDVQLTRVSGVVYAIGGTYTSYYIGMSLSIDRNKRDLIWSEYLIESCLNAFYFARQSFYLLFVALLIGLAVKNALIKQMQN